MQTGQVRLLYLTNAQCTRIHGWFNPKRTLSWEDIVSKPSLTVRYLTEHGLVTDTQLHMLQPDVHEWIRFKGVSFEDVPRMTLWPLHPITHLRGDLSDIVEGRYGAKLLKQLGINFQMLKAMGLTAEWMKMLNFQLREWVDLGLTAQEAEVFTDREIYFLFGTTSTNLQMAITMADNVNKQCARMGLG